MTVLDLLARGGPLLWSILVCSVVALVVIIERHVVLRRASVDSRQFLSKLKVLLRRGDLRGVLAYCEQQDPPIAAIVRAGLARLEKGPGGVREALELAGREQVSLLEAHLSVLATIAGIAPMLGILGTVIGLMGIFRAADAAGGAASLGLFTAGVWEMLLITASGFAVAIPTFVWHNYFVSRIGRLVHNMETAATDFMDHVEHQLPGQVPGVPVLHGLEPAELQEDEFFRRKR